MVANANFICRLVSAFSEGFDEEFKTWIEQHGIPFTLYSTLSDIKEDDSITKKFEVGEIPFGFDPDYYKLKQPTELFKKIKTEMEDKKNKGNELEQKINDTKEKIKQLQLELTGYQNELAVTKQDVSIWEKYSSDIEKTSTICKTAAKIEEDLANSVSQQMEEDYIGFSAISEVDSVVPKLSLLLNGAGLSSQYISKFESADGQSFLNCSNITEDCTFLERLDITYFKDMYSRKLIPYSKHDCAVCTCTSSNELFHMIKEHEIEISDSFLDAITYYKLNGPRILMLEEPDLINIFNIPKEEAELIMTNFISYFVNIHRADMEEEESRD